MNHVGPSLLPAAGALLEVEVDSVDLEVVFPSGNLGVEKVISWHKYQKGLNFGIFRVFVCLSLFRAPSLVECHEREIESDQAI